MPATYEVNGRQFIAFPVAAGTGGFSIRFGGPPRGQPAPANESPEAQAAAGARGRGGRAGGPPPQPGAYIVYALPPR